METTIKDITLHLAKERYAAALVASIDGTGSDEAVAVALVALEAAELANEQTMTYTTSAYATNYR